MAIRVHSSLTLAALGVGVAFMACGPSAETNPTPNPSTTGPVAPVPTNGPDPNVAPTGVTPGVAPTDVAPTGVAPTGVSPTDVAPTPSEPNECDGPGDSYVSTLLNEGACETKAPPNCLINEFATTFQCPSTGGVAECSSCCWGDETSLTGGDIKYQNGDDDSTMEYTATGTSVTLSGSTASYAGFGLWFGPCTDASTWDGVEVQIKGDLGGGQLMVQLQTDENYPKEDGKGACDWGTDEANKWNICTNPQVEVTGVDATSENPFRFTWAEFSGGKPNDKVDPRQLRGIQLQVNCPTPEPAGDGGVAPESAPCAFNLELMDLRWFKNVAQ
jgi:hypothetical protein